MYQNIPSGLDYPRLMVANITGHNCEPKGQEFRWILLNGLLPTSPTTKDSTDIDLINVLDTETHDIKSLQQKDPYWMHIA